MMNSRNVCQYHGKVLCKILITKGKENVFYCRGMFLPHLKFDLEISFLKRS